ncbi:MAG: hypothetical protein A2516_02645 [Alphaproteobacteria bacterium RIFOXYD12_FULL_60_8]|nr:MAG: hypothetical protein A2516_02645 [Alphaproteobacteria bacterium RIFOXYD12_FULL_60_8]
MGRKHLLAVSTLVAVSAFSGATNAAEVVNVRIGEHATTTRIVLDLSGPVAYRYALSADRRQILVDLPDSQWGSETAKAVSYSKFIRGYSYTNGRLTIDTTAQVSIADARALTPSDGAGHRLYFDLATAPAVASPFTSPTYSPAPLSVAQVAPTPLPVEAPMEPQAENAPAWPDGSPASQAAQEARNEPRQDMSGGDDSSGMYFRLDGLFAISGSAGLEQAGYTGTIDDIGEGIGGDIGLGWRLGPGFRTDVTLGMISNHGFSEAKAGTTYTGDVSNVSAMLNGYLDIPIGGNVTPYVGFGLGPSLNTMDNVTLSSGTTIEGASTTTLGYQGMAGVSFKMSPTWDLDFGYRYFNGGRLASDQVTTGGAAIDDFDGEFIDHQFVLGVRSSF